LNFVSGSRTLYIFVYGSLFVRKDGKITVENAGMSSVRLVIKSSPPYIEGFSSNV